MSFLSVKQTGHSATSSSGGREAETGGAEAGGGG